MRGGFLKDTVGHPAESLDKEAPETWTNQEKWVWQKIKEGKTADLNQREGQRFAKAGDEGSPPDKNRVVLSREFLETILRAKEYKKHITQYGVSITGACFKEPLDLSGLTIEHQLMLADCLFLSDVDLSSVKSLDSIVLDGSMFSGKLTMNSIQVEFNLNMRKKARFDSEVSLVSAKIGSRLDIGGSIFRKKLNMNSLEVENFLFLHDKCLFEGDVSLAFARIGDHLEISDSTFMGNVTMNNMQVSQSVFINDNSRFDNPVDLVSVSVGNYIDFKDSFFSKTLNMDRLKAGNNVSIHGDCHFEGDVRMMAATIKGNLSMNGLTFSGNVNLQRLNVLGSLNMQNNISQNSTELLFSTIHNNLDISSSTFKSLDLTGANIKGKFILGSGRMSPVNWVKGAQLILRNAHAGIVEDMENAWPDKVMLSGFIYSRLGGSESSSAHSIATRKISWMKEWLKKQDFYSPQPYEQLSKVLKNMGYKSKANKILFAARERERENAKGLDKVWLTLQHEFTGYGIYTGYLIVWVFFLVLFGMFFLSFSGQGISNKIQYGFYYSVDMLLPFIKLNKHHYEINLLGLTRYYFCFMQIMGYVLLFFFIAGPFVNKTKK